MKPQGKQNRKQQPGKNIVYYLFPIIYCLSPFLVQAQTPSVLLPSTKPLEFKLLNPEATPPRGNVITANSMSETGLTNPSLWWADEQFGGKLLENWLAYPNERRVDLIVNRQLWSILDYMGRYSFVNKMGTVARDFGYSTRVFIVNEPDEALATYTCDFSTSIPVCDLNIQSIGQDSWRVRSRN
jgi:hypothetical protein